MRVLTSDDLPTVAFKVCTHLHAHGIQAVLTGGSAATVYAPDAYQSRDMDFILTFHSSMEAVEAAIAELGFVASGRIYSHPDIVPTLDFVGDELVVRQR